MIYENLKCTYGPYEGKDGRLRMILVFTNKTKKLISYPKYLMECHLERYLEENETIDHIDGNPLNNDITNLRVLPRVEHCKNDALRNKNAIVKCAYCGKEFSIEGFRLHNRNRKDRHHSGYFCSRKCSGKYGAEIQHNKRTHTFVEKIKPEKYSLHEEN